MKVFVTVSVLVTLLVFIGVSDKVTARPDGQLLQSAEPHEVWDKCGTWCPNTCAEPDKEDDGCVLMCNPAYFCESGYIREFENGRCILPTDCPTST